jgi:hypothetical protein
MCLAQEGSSYEDAEIERLQNEKKLLNQGFYYGGTLNLFSLIYLTPRNQGIDHSFYVFNGIGLSVNLVTLTRVIVINRKIKKLEKIKENTK